MKRNGLYKFSYNSFHGIDNFGKCATDNFYKVHRMTWANSSTYFPQFGFWSFITTDFHSSNKAEISDNYAREEVNWKIDS